MHNSEAFVCNRNKLKIMKANFISETDIQQKEAELELIIQEYYRYDMGELKTKIKKVFDKELQSVDTER